MFYRPADGHGLPHNPFNAIVSPRPIGWISTRDADGHDNLAPYSFFNAVAYVPPQVMFASTGAKPDRPANKDSVSNIRETGVFCVNVVSKALLMAMNTSSGAWDRDVDEFSLAALERAECDTIPCSYVKDAPATLECRMTQIIELGGKDNTMVIGEVTGIRLHDDCLIDGRFAYETFTPVGRLGYRDYAYVDDAFQLARPSDK
ncbi:flavin reductase family protein [Rhodobacter sp. NTK016B]|uniref:flavin reductase family protein n=1 Tax=Rhodobacter sp. NTK016B TaxID=2759676 RepID=UPI001A8C063C|nr:flavin reductase family protein [Rhodobacter sp. NTK016B]MBN8293173.1 flavin reductase family protein [Rhodobacter sp. NTK016B]